MAAPCALAIVLEAPGARRCVQWNFLVVKPAPRAPEPHGGSAGQDKIAKLLAGGVHPRCLRKPRLPAQD